MYLKSKEISEKYGIRPCHIKRDIGDKGARSKEYIFCNRKCTAYYEPDVARIVAKRNKTRLETKKRYDARPNVLRGTKSSLYKVIDRTMYKKLRNAWFGMQRRCYTNERKDYHHYREAGIKVCDEWLNSFDAFAIWALNNGVELNLSIDRIDNEKGYSPENCRWTTKVIQNNNSSAVHTICYQGEEMTITEWAERLGMERDTLYARLFSSGWSVEKALTTPVRKRK